MQYPSFFTRSSLKTRNERAKTPPAIAETDKLTLKKVSNINHKPYKLKQNVSIADTYKVYKQ